jgi:xylulokinase
LPAGTPVVLGGHDFLCGMLPVGAFQPGVVLDVMGTWDIVTVALDEPVLTPAVQRMGWWIDSHVARGKYAAMGSAVAADMLEWFRREWCPHGNAGASPAGAADWDGLMAVAEASPPGAHGVMFLPHMSGRLVPSADPKSKGAFIGLRNQATQGDLVRAMIEGLNYQFLEILSGLEAAVGVTPHKLVVGGGGRRNHFWIQNRADMAGRAIEVPEIEETSSLGAAVLAGIGVGLYRDEADAFAQVYRPGPVYQPNPERTAFYAERFGLFQKLYPALTELHAEL